MNAPDLSRSVGVASIVLEGAGIESHLYRYISEKNLLMKLSYPINLPAKGISKHSYHLFHSALASGFLALAACTTLAPNHSNQTANYIDIRPPASNQKVEPTDPTYDWSY